MEQKGSECQPGSNEILAMHLKVSGNWAAVVLELTGGSTDARNCTGQWKYVRKKTSMQWGIHTCCNCTLLLPNCAAFFFLQPTITWGKKNKGKN